MMAFLEAGRGFVIWKDTPDRARKQAGGESFSGISSGLPAARHCPPGVCQLGNLRAERKTLPGMRSGDSDNRIFLMTVFAGPVQSDTSMSGRMKMS